MRTERVDAFRNYRQGMSVIDVDGLTVRDSTFRATHGVPPQAGVDLEPDLPTQRLSRINFTNCSFLNNTGAGFQVVPGNLDSTSAPLTISFSGHTVAGNLYGVAIIDARPAVHGSFAAGSHIIVEDVSIDGSVQEGVVRNHSSPRLLALIPPNALLVVGRAS